MCTGWAGIISREGIRWHTDIVRSAITNGPGGLTNTVGVRAVIAGNGAILKTCSLVASTVDGVVTPGVRTSI